MRNIVLIFTDQQRQDSLKCYNKESPVHTPNIDALCRDSVIFNQAYTACPVCTPARAALHTGLFPSKTGMETNIYQSGARTHEIAVTERMLPLRLREVGYNCGYTGKWHLGVGKDKTESEEGRMFLKFKDRGDMSVCAYENYGTLPTDAGYIGDDFAGHGSGGYDYPLYKQYLKENGLELKIVNKTTDKKPIDHSTVGEIVSPKESSVEHFLMSRAIGLAEQLKNQNKPFFLNINFWGPHEPFFAVSEFLDMYRNLDIPEWQNTKCNVPDHIGICKILQRKEVEWSFFQNTLKHYYACISNIDYQIGRLIRYLKENDLYDDTMIIFAADHGDYQGSHGKMENKSYGMYDEITKIPLIIKPFGKDFGRICDKLVGTCDIYATILRAAGCAGETGDGNDLNVLLKDIDAPWNNEILCEGMGAFPIIATQRMYRNDRYKYVFHAGYIEELYDMKEDPREINNLANDANHAELLQKIRSDCHRYMKKHSDPIANAFAKINELDIWKAE